MSSYEGEWNCGKRHGWGRMSYTDCSIYEGEWCDGKRCGQGMLRLRKLLLDKMINWHTVKFVNLYICSTDEQYYYYIMKSYTRHSNIGKYKKKN